MLEINEMFFNKIDNKYPKNKWFWGTDKFNSKECFDFKIMKFFYYYL